MTPTMDTSAPVLRTTAPFLLRKVRDQNEGLTFFDSKRLVESEHLRLARNAEFDRFFSQVPGGVAFNSGNMARNAWTETIVGYPKPGEPLGDAIEWTDPQTGLRQYLDTRNFRGEKVALAFEGCSVIVDGGTILYVPNTDILVVERFPTENGLYSRHQLTGVPVVGTSDATYGSPDSRYLYRVADQWVGPAVRSYSRIAVPDDFDRTIYLSFRPSCNLGIFVAEAH